MARPFYLSNAHYVLRDLQSLALCNIFVPRPNLSESDNTNEEDTMAGQEFKFMSVKLSREEHGGRDSHNGHDGINSGVISGGRGYQCWYR